MVVVKAAKSRGSRDVNGAADEMNGFNQGHPQGQKEGNFGSFSSYQKAFEAPFDNCSCSAH